MACSSQCSEQSRAPRRRPARGWCLRVMAALLLPSCMDVPDGRQAEAPRSLAGSTPDAVAMAPAHVLAGQPGDEAFDFHQVIGGFIDSDHGLIVVANRGDRTIRLFRRDGTWIETKGGSGDGPREFEDLSTVLEYRGDSLLAFDPSRQRATVWPYTSGRVRGISRPAMPDSFGLVSLGGTLTDGSLLWTAPIVDYRVDQRGGSHPVGVTLFLTSAEGENVRVLARTPGTVRYRYDRSRFATGNVPFSPMAFAIVQDSTVFYGTTATPEIRRVATSGKPLPPLPFDLPRRAVSAADRSRDLRARRQRLEAQPATPLRSATLEALPELPYPDSFPVFGRVFVGRDQRIWASTFRPAHAANRARAPDTPQWFVRSTSQALAREAGLEGDLAPIWFGRSEVLAVLRDELDVERVVIVPIPTGGSPR